MKFYLSHPIRAPKGDEATHTDMKANCDKAIEIANYLRENITANIEIYVPAEHEDFVQLAYQWDYLNEHQILDIDCAILDRCDAVLLYAPYGTPTGGCKIELDFAIENNIPVIVFYDKGYILRALATYITRT